MLIYLSADGEKKKVNVVNFKYLLESFKSPVINFFCEFDWYIFDPKKKANFLIQDMRDPNDRTTPNTNDGRQLIPNQWTKKTLNGK